MVIVGIDIGYARTGWGVVDSSPKFKNNFKLVDYGCIETDKGTLFPERLVLIERDLRDIISKHKPAEAHVEELFFAKNQTTAMKVAAARGVIQLTLQKQNIPIVDIKPQHVKQGLTGYGNADKQQMQEMVRMILDLEEVPQPDDAADALALAMVAA